MYKYDRQKLIDLIKSDSKRIIDERVFALNIIGIRSSLDLVNAFNDLFIIIMKLQDGTNIYYEFPGSTKPGLSHLLIPINPKGCAIVKEGYYKNLWQKGFHKGKPALVQVNKITVIRDFDKDAELDYNSGIEESGIFGINFHRCGLNSEIVNNWSAGCQVSKRARDIDLLIRYADIQTSKLNLKYISYNLINEKMAIPALKTEA